MPYIVKKTLNQIVKSKNDYVIKLKKNQPKLFEAAKRTVDTGKCIGSSIQYDKKRGREEIRETFLYQRCKGLDKSWKSVKMFVKVVRTFKQKGKIYQSESIYITSLKTKNAMLIADIIRSHWFVEIKLHYPKDVVMLEDTTSTKDKNAASVLALFRDFAFNILKTKNKSIKYATEIFSESTVTSTINLILRT